MVGFFSNQWNTFFRIGYVRYMNVRREELRKEAPDMHHLEVTKKIGEEWMTLSDDKKQPYLDAAKQDKIRYEYVELFGIFNEWRHLIVNYFQMNSFVLERILFCLANTFVGPTYVSMNDTQIIDIFELQKTSFSLQIQNGNESV